MPPASHPPAPDVVDALRRVPLFAELPDDGLRWIVDEGDEVALEPGDMLFEKNDPVEWMYVGVDGLVEARRDGAGAPVWSFGPGQLYGVIPFSRMQTAPAAGRASGRARVFRFPRERFPALLERLPALEAAFVGFLADRVRESTRRDQQFEKLTALGRLSAGLAHELNNPAAAARRSAADARGRLDEGARRAAALVEVLGAAGESCTAAVLAPDALRARRPAADPDAADDPLARGDREQEVGDWLERAAAPDAWSLAATFAEAGLGSADLDAVLGPLPAAARGPAAAWCESALALDALLATVERAAGRISELVGAVKSYTHMDRGHAAEPVDVRAGVETTLTLFAHKFRDRRVALERDLAAGLPRVRGFAGELNQVWTNLLDNAIDAAAESEAGPPRVAVRARREDGRVVVEVEDNGRGVPADLQARIWEPFFTTKEVGRGTGLGLDIARHVVEQHGGELALDSAPGRTVFAVRLPAQPNA